MAREQAVILLLGCFGLTIATHRVINSKILSGKRDVLNFPTPYNKQFNSPPSIDALLQPPPYMRSLLNAVLDLKAGGHQNYLNVYPSSWTTSQVNSELTVDVQFTALANSQNVHCSAHIMASMPPDNNNPTMVPSGTTVHCTPSGGATQSFPPTNAVSLSNRYRAPAVNVPRTPLYNTNPYYFGPQGPHVVYKTKLVPINVPTIIPPALQPDPYPGGYPLLPPAPVNNPSYPQMIPSGGYPFLPPALVNNPSYPQMIPTGPIGAPLYNPYDGIPVNNVLPVMPNYRVMM